MRCLFCNPHHHSPRSRRARFSLCSVCQTGSVNTSNASSSLLPKRISSTGISLRRAGSLSSLTSQLKCHFQKKKIRNPSPGALKCVPHPDPLYPTPCLSSFPNEGEGHTSLVHGCTHNSYKVLGTHQGSEKESEHAREHTAFTNGPKQTGRRQTEPVTVALFTQPSFNKQFKNYLPKKARCVEHVLSPDADYTVNKLPNPFFYEIRILWHSSFLLQCFPAFFRRSVEKTRKYIKKMSCKFLPTPDPTVHPNILSSGSQARWLPGETAGSLPASLSIHPSTHLSRCPSSLSIKHTYQDTHAYVYLHSIHTVLQTV